MLDDDEEEEFHDPNEFVEDLKNNPGSGKSLMILGQKMKKEYSIIRTEDNDFFYYDKKYEYMKPLNSNLYGYYVSKSFGLNLPDRYIKDSLSSIQGIAKNQRHLWEFKNKLYLNTKDKYTIQKLGKPQITSRKFIFEDELIRYFGDENHKHNVNLFNENPTKVEQTLREILIPKNDINNHKLYKDTLYLLGASLINGNPLKSLVIYYNERGNNGKTILGYIIKKMFNSTCVTVQPSEFKDTFFNKRIDDTNIILIDEIQDSSLDKYWDLIKKISGGVINDNLREMRKDTRVESKGKGLLYILTNELPNVPLADTALLYRILVYYLPNRFVDNPQRPNEIQVNRNIVNELSKDREGFEWLVNACIYTYNNYKFERQSEEDTKYILSKSNIIRQWLVKNTKIHEYDRVTNRELKECLEDDIDGDITIPSNILNSKIGSELKKIYGSRLERTKASNDTYYNLTMVE